MVQAGYPINHNINLVSRRFVSMTKGNTDQKQVQVQQIILHQQF